MFGQENLLDVPEWYLKQLFRSSSEIPGSYNEDLLWKHPASTALLLDKLKSEYYLDRGKAIKYLGLTKDPENIEICASFLQKDPHEFVKVNAIKSLIQYDVPEIPNILNQYLLELDHRQTSILAELVAAISKRTYKSSVEPLKLYREQNKDHLSSFYMNKLDEAIRIIENYHIDANSRYEVIKGKLFSNQLGDISWAIYKIRNAKDASYLPLLREYTNQVDKKSYYGKYKEVVTLKRSLGDDQFNSGELQLLAKIDQELKNVELEKAKELEKIKNALPPKQIDDF